MPSNFKVLSGASGEPNDPNFKNVTLLLHGDGSNGAQNNTFIDSSTNNFTITRNGNTTQGSFSPYGSNWSNYFDGNGDYLTAAANAAFAFGTGDFTVEGWVCLNQVTSTFAKPIAGTHYYSPGTSDRGWGFGVGATGLPIFFMFGSTGAGYVLTGSTTLSAGQWYHLAVTRSGTTVRIFVNGVQDASGTSAYNEDYTGAALKIATDEATSLSPSIGNSGVSINGYISNVRIVKGTSVYTSAFTPPTTPLTAISGTSLLTCQSNRFRDASTNNFTITRNGDVKVTNFSPFAPSAAYSTTTNGGSAYFDGSGDYLQTPSNSAIAIGSGDFTLECWIYAIGSPYNAGIYDGRSTGNATDGFTLTAFDTGNIRVWCGGSLISTSGLAYVNQWVHIAVVRASGTTTMYINGVSYGSTTSTIGGTNTDAVIAGGRYTSGSGVSTFFPGYITGFRIVKGTAVYTAAFTPPSSPVTAITNTSLLLNATNAAIFDNSMKNDLETVGNAQISTSVKKFGTGSIYVPVSGGCALIPNSQPLVLGTGNWTVEFWAYTDASGSKVYLDAINAANTTLNMEIYSSGTTIYWVKPGGAVAITGTGALSANTWQHIAACKSGSSTKLFVNGTQVGSTYTDNDTYDTARWEIGGRANLAYPIVGYMDDFRITTGVARYTSNFTAPTAPFPNK